jgi:hypothetical protein
MQKNTQVWCFTPTNKGWCLHQCVFFCLLDCLWVSYKSTTSLALIICLASTQIASFSWYPCHFTKYSLSFFLVFLHFKIPSTSYSRWSPTNSGVGPNTCLRCGLNVSSWYGLSNDTWNVGCTLISAGSINCTHPQTVFSQWQTDPHTSPWIWELGLLVRWSFSHSTRPFGPLHTQHSVVLCSLGPYISFVP